MTTILVGGLWAGLPACSDLLEPEPYGGGGSPGPPTPWTPPTGSSAGPRLVVTATMEGLPPDPDGFTVSLGDGAAVRIAPHDGTPSFQPEAEARYRSLDPGPYEVTLGDLAEGCHVAGDNPRVVDVQSWESVRFAVACRGLERLEDRIVFGRRGGTYVIRPDGSSPARLSALHWAGGDVSSDGRLLVIAGEGLHVVRADGAPVRVLREGPVGDPAWSPDGRWIAYVEGVGEEANLYLIRSDGRGRRPLTSGPTRDGHPSWSPDGGTIVFEREGDGAHDLYTIGVDGTDLRRLTDGERREYDPAWSPDGNRIAFAEGPLVETQSGDHDLRVLYLDTGHAAWVLAAWVRICGPAWSPDGDEIVFQGLKPDRSWSYSSPENGLPGPSLSRLDDPVPCAGRLWVTADQPMVAQRTVFETGSAPTWSPGRTSP